MQSLRAFIASDKTVGHVRTRDHPAGSRWLHHRFVWRAAQLQQARIAGPAAVFVASNGVCPIIALLPHSNRC